MFTSPNVLAMILNVFLLLLAARLLLGRAKRVEFALFFLLLLGELATQSRGGLVALLGGAIILVILIRRAAVSWNTRASIGLFAGCLAALVLQMVTPPQSGVKQPGIERVTATVAQGDTAGRSELYSLVWDRIAASPWRGDGYLSFGALYRRSGLNLFRGKTTQYVHSDYLQVWLELGLVGLVLLVTLIVSSAWLLWSRLPIVDAGSARTSIGVGAAAGAIALHAVVDFPFYVPGIVLLMALGLGVLQTQLVAPGVPVAAGERSKGKIPRLAIHAAAIILVLALSLPAISEILSVRAERALRAGDESSAITQLQVARRLTPYLAYYHRVLAVVWREKAVAENSGEAAKRAEQLFAAALDADPQDVISLSERLTLHRDHRHLLPSPATSERLTTWAQQLLWLRPGSEVAVMQYLRTLRYVGDCKTAQRLANDLFANSADTTQLERLRTELQREDCKSQ